MRKIGIFFGGKSREREISFGSGRTVYDNIDKSKYIPVPIFVDSLGNFIILNWQYIYKGSILDFFPSSDLSDTLNSSLYIESYAEDSNFIEKEVNRIGKKIYPHNFHEYIDFAFLALHGKFGEDGLIQSVLEWYNIPYSGSGVLGSAIGIDKIFQKKILTNNKFTTVDSIDICRAEWVKKATREEFAEDMFNKLGSNLVIKSNTQGSSIGVSVVKSKNSADLISAIHKSFFIYEVFHNEWCNYNDIEKINLLNSLANITDGVLFPVCIGEKFFYKPSELNFFLDNYFQNNKRSVLIESLNREDQITIEKYIKGREFSCIVLQTKDTEAFALPPTELIKSSEMLSYSGKYLPGSTRKETPIDLPLEQFEYLCNECIRAFNVLNFKTYARIDGIIDESFKIFINDPNTTAGMLPSSFLFNQAAEIGLSPKQLISFIIEQR